MKSTKMNRWPSGRGTLWIVAGLFAASATIRFASGPAQAIAQEMAALRGPDTVPLAMAGKTTCTDPAEIQKILDGLAARDRELSEREKKLQELESSLEFAKEQVRKNMSALKDAEEKLAATLALSETAAESDLARLTAVYENMKPQQAASLFEQMAPEFAAGFMGRMRPDAAAQIMAGLAPETAYTISVILAGRNANAPTE